MTLGSFIYTSRVFERDIKNIRAIDLEKLTLKKKNIKKEKKKQRRKKERENKRGLNFGIGSKEYN